ncbi:MAG: ribulose-phosphate 3-epimerase [Candidatus Paceibacterota bacterium]|jgi:ribulose-phosphate 3-epimerase
MEIIPSIIASNFAEIKNKIAKLEGLVNWIELDVMDGVFVPNVSWQTEEDLKEIYGKIKISAHLMMENPEALIEDWQKLVDRIIVHFEATDALPSLLQHFDGKNNPCEIGLALELETPLEKIKPYLRQIKIFQLMSIANIGYQGEKFDLRVLPKLRELRKLAPEAQIIIDGGINPKTAKEVISAGADALVVGSYIWQNNDLKEAIEKLRQS